MKSQIIETKSHIKKEKPSKEVQKLIDEANQFVRSAEGKIKAAYNYATKIDKMEPKAAARMLYDNLKYTPQWIRKFLPDEAIHKGKGRTISNVRRALLKKRKMMITGTLVKAHRDREAQGEEISAETITVPAEKFKQFLLGLIDIQEKATKYGVLIHKDLTIELISS